MNTHTRIARASAALVAATLIGAAAAAAQPSDAQNGLSAARTGTEVDPSAACLTVGTPTSPERFLCYRAAANLANEPSNLPAGPAMTVTRPIVVGGTTFDWTDAGVGFAAAVGIGLIGRVTVIAGPAGRLEGSLARLAAAR